MVVHVRKSFPISNPKNATIETVSRLNHREKIKDRADGVGIYTTMQRAIPYSINYGSMNKMVV